MHQDREHRMGSWNFPPPACPPITEPSERNASPTVSAPQDELRDRLPAQTLADGHRLRRSVGGLRRARDPRARAQQRQKIAADIANAEERIARRRAAVPV